MVIKKVDLECVVGVSTKVLPQNGQPEIAFAGRSNVGKSSLINALMNRRNYARVSETPGKTQTINFYHINEEFYYVDLPGYGYAKVSKDFKASWGKMIERYLHSSKDLRAIFLLLDMRRTPSPDDLQMYDWLRGNGYTPYVIVTKADKLKKTQRDKVLQEIRDTLISRAPLREGEELIMQPFSAKDKSGREEIYEIIDSLLST